MNNRLLKKSFDLTTSKIYGGGTTFKICYVVTNNDPNCSDTQTTETSDSGEVETCTQYVCE